MFKLHICNIMSDSEIELGIRRYKSLPSNLNDCKDIDTSENPLIIRHSTVNSVGIGTDPPPRPIAKLGIINNFVECFRTGQNYLEQKEIWTKIKEKFNDYFPYVLHYYTHLIFIIVFEIIFYFKYAVTIEKELIQNLITSIVETIVDIYFQHNPEANRIILTQEMAQAICDKYNDMTNNHNNVIYENCLLGIIVLISIFSIILLIGTRLYGYKLVMSVIADSIMLIMLLAIFEYFFFAYIILGYQIITMGEIICIAVNTVYQYMKTHQ